MGRGDWGGVAAASYWPGELWTAIQRDGPNHLELWLIRPASYWPGPNAGAGRDLCDGGRWGAVWGEAAAGGRWMRAYLVVLGQHLVELAVVVHRVGLTQSTQQLWTAIQRDGPNHLELWLIRPPVSRTHKACGRFCGRGVSPAGRRAGRTPPGS